MPFPGSTMLSDRPLAPPLPRFLQDNATHVQLWQEGAEHWATLRYWHAHESWETIWRSSDSTHASSVRACIQLAAALYKPFQVERLRALGKPECAGLVDGMRRLLDRARAGFDDSLDAELGAWFGREWQRAESQWRVWKDKTTCATGCGDSSGGVPLTEANGR